MRRLINRGPHRPRSGLWGFIIGALCLAAALVVAQGAVVLGVVLVAGGTPAAAPPAAAPAPEGPAAHGPGSGYWWERGPTYRHDLTVYAAPGRPQAPMVSGEVLIGWADPAIPDASIDDVLARHGLTRIDTDRVLGFTRAEAQTVIAPLLDALAGEAAVRYAEPNFVAEAALTPNDRMFGLEGGTRSIGCETAWNVTQGSPTVIVAVLDTGIDLAHEDLRANLLAGTNFLNPAAPPDDDSGHGTAVAGIIAAQSGNTVGLSGVAPNCRILPVKVADANGFAAIADLASGIRWAADQGARIINISMGSRVHAQALKDAVDYAVSRGALIVASAGNENSNYEMYPARYDNVIAVGGAGSLLGVNTPVPGPIRLAHSTVLSQTLDVLAPSEDIVSTLPGSLYAYVTGTSAAAGFVSGVAALALSADPTLTRDQLAQIVRQAQIEIPDLAVARRIYTAGRIDAALAVARASANYVDASVFDVQVFPKKPQPGVHTVIRITVENEGNQAIASMILKAKFNGIELTPVAVQNLAVGERRDLDFDWFPPSAGTYTLTGEITALSGETETADNTRDLANVTVDATTEADVRVTALSISEPNIALGQVQVTIEAENRGTQPAANVQVSATLAGAPVGLANLGTLPVAGAARTTLAWTIPATPPSGILLLTASVAAQPGEVATQDNQAYLEFVLGQMTTRPVQMLYQQSNGVDIIPDAPARIVPGVPYVPVSIFVASKGDPDTNTKLWFDGVTVDLLTAPTGSGTRVYDDSTGTDIQGQPSRWVQGLEVLDEMARPQIRNGSTNPNIFEDQELTLNGRHTILRVPRQAFGVSLQPAAAEDRYIDVRCDWRTERRIFWFFTITDSGTHHKVLRVRFAADPLPTVPGDTHYYDVHHHTIAEWSFGSPLDIFAPRKAYGGPIVMVRETAYAMGLIPSPDAIYDQVITTDHNCFYNETLQNPDGPNERPPFGFAAPSNSFDPITGHVRREAEQYRHLFGLAAGEELSFKQGQGVPAVPNLPYLDPLLSLLTFPLGAHALIYRCEHIEGPWHGGGWIPQGFNPPAVSEVIFDDVFRRLSTQNQTVNERAFTYAAHPYSGQGWSEQNIDLITGQNPGQRGTDFLHPGTEDFIFKGFQLYNGWTAREVDSASVNFRDINPFTNAHFAAGDPDWDHVLQIGLIDWHRRISDVMLWSLDAAPSEVFLHKLYIAGGSDAHGDFNYSVDRLATPIDIQSTFSVGSSFYGSVRTYVLADGVPGGSAGERWMTAYAEGNTVVTDGPVVEFSMDANARFDSSTLAWHDGRVSADDADGRMGGAGAFDGGRTMLCVRGSSDAQFRYRWTNASDYGSNGGQIAAINVYADRPGAPNPNHSRGSFDEIAGVGSLAVGPEGTLLTEPLDANQEGLVTTPVAYSLGGFTGGDPDQAPIGLEERRCYTNPVWAVPVDVQVTLQPDPQTGQIPVGGLTVEYTFSTSMDATFAFPVGVKQLDAQGNSTDASTPDLATLQGTWGAAGGLTSNVYTASNTQAIPLAGAGYPDANHITFVIYTREAPKDLHGSSLNPVALTTQTNHPNPGGGGTTGGSTGSTSGSGSGHGSGGGLFGCDAGAGASNPGPAALLPLAWLLILLGLARAWVVRR